MSRRTLLTLLSFAAFASLGLPDGLLGVAWPSIRASFRQPLDALGLLVAVTTAGYLASSFLGGALQRLVPIGTLLTLSTAAAAAALLGFAATPYWPLMLALGFLAGFGGGAVDASLNAYAATHFTARTLNWLHACFGLGSTLGPLIVTAVLEGGLVWRWSYAVVGCIQGALALAFLATRRRWSEVSEIAGSQAPPPVRPAPAFETLRRPGVWLGMLVFFLYSGVEFAAAQWSYSLMTLGRGIDETTAGFFVSLYWGSLMIGRVLFGVADRLPLAATLRVCLGLGVAGAVLFWIDASPALSLAGLMTIGFSFAPVFASLISLTPGRVGAEHAASAIGFQVAAAALGGAAVTAGVGVLAAAAGLEVIGASIAAAALALFVAHEALVRATPRA